MKVPLHWAIKFPLILAITLAVLLVSYHYLVRPTFIGALLNGRKYPRGKRATEPRAGSERAGTARAGTAPARHTRLCAPHRRRPSSGRQRARTRRAAHERREALRQDRRARRRESHGPARRAAGSARPERRRQDDGHWTMARLARAQRRRSHAHGRLADRRAEPARRRSHDAGDRSGPGVAGARAHRADGELLPQSALGGGDARAHGHRGARRQALRQALGRPEAPSAVRDHRLRAAEAVVPGRADRRARHHGARNHVADDPAASSTTAARSCSRRTIWRKPKRSPIASS